MVENTFQSIRILKLSNLELEMSSLSTFHPDTSPTASLPKGDVTQSQAPSWYLFLICKLPTQIKPTSWSSIHEPWNYPCPKTLSKISNPYLHQAGCLPWLPICLSFSSADWHTRVSCFLSTLYCTFWENHLCVSMWSAQSASPDRASDNTKCIRNQIQSSCQNT